MKKLLLISFLLISTLGLVGCGSGDKDISQMAGAMCEMGDLLTQGKMFTMSEEDAAELEKKYANLEEVGKRIEEKYKGKEAEAEKLFIEAMNNQCPETYKKMEDMGMNMDIEGGLGN